jgi:eukaryotic-like serine/threonine-protein kinase
MTETASTVGVDTEIGNYRVIRKLGEGGMGAVYLAEHALLRRKAAVKILHASFTQREDMVERFFNEARASTSIADPGIVQIFDFGYHGTMAYIVMEFLEGESLDARLKRLGKLDLADVLRLARQMSLSLYAAHKQGVVHRDLKPENVFIVNDPEVAGGERTKILDFGIAKLTDTEQSRVRTQTGLMMGTPVYMSPEQCRGAGTLDHRADIYSLGCVIFHLLAGRPPFNYDGAGELIAAHLKEPAPVPSQFVPLPASIDQVVSRCLDKVPEARFGSMRELAQELDVTLRKISHIGLDLSRLTPVPGVSQMIPTTLSMTTDVTPRRRLWQPLVAVGLVAIGAIIALLFLKSSDKPAPIAAPAPVVAPPPPPVVAQPPPSLPPPVVVEPPPPPPPPVVETKPAPKPAVVVHTAPPPKRKPIATSTSPGSASTATPASGSAAIDPYSDR